MDASGTVAVLGAATALVVAIPGAVAAIKGLRVIRDVQTKVNGMHSDDQERKAQLTDFITESGGTVPTDPSIGRHRST